MCEVTIKNFDEILPELEKNLKNARFIAIDTEFSCLTASDKLQNSLFDSAQERYTKLRKTVQQVIPTQIGLTAFTFDADNNSYKGNIYTFYVFPRPFAFLDLKFLCQASSFLFLSAHNFNFNKFVNEGIPFLNCTQEDDLRRNIKNLIVGNSCLVSELENILEEYTEIISKWIHNAKYNETFLIKDVELLKNNLDVKYFLHKEFRNRFKELWTFEDNEGFKLQKTPPEVYADHVKHSNLDEELILDLLGFTRVFRLLVSLQKPIIGHNLLLDLMFIVHNFERPLPNSYLGFKKIVHTLFPIIYDTKCITFDIFRVIPKTKSCGKNVLDNLYKYFKDGHGRHLAPNSPLIEHQNGCPETFHYAGWDSFCTGYIFIRMAHIFAAEKCKVTRKIFMSNELLQAVKEFVNKINIIRGDLSYIQLDGDDPQSRRPPWLIVQGIKWKPININEVTTLLSSYGFVEVKPHSYKGQRAIIAVDNFGSARRILNEFQSHSDFRIQQYNFLKHSPIANAFLWSGIILSGSFLAWYGYLKIR